MKKLLFFLAAFFIVLSMSFSQEPPHPGGGNPPGGGDTPVGGGAPLDGGIGILLILGLTYGSKKTFYFKKTKI